MTVKDALKHPWIAGDAIEEFNKKLLVAENIKKNFTAKQKFKATVEAIRAAGRMAIFSPVNSEKSPLPKQSEIPSDKNQNSIGNNSEKTNKQWLIETNKTKDIILYYIILKIYIYFCILTRKKKKNFLYSID